MKSNVEIFLMDEVTELIHDNEKLDSWNAIVENLGLEGQAKIVTKKKSPIPFLPMNNSMENVYKTLCPKSVEISEFDVQPIPVEILEMVSLAVKENYFNRIVIWYDDKTPDPVCIGQKGHYYQSTWWNNDRNKDLDNEKWDSIKEAKDAGGVNLNFNASQSYLIGCWGNEKKYSFEELREMAINRHITLEKNKLEKEIKDAQRRMDDLKNEAITKFY